MATRQEIQVARDLIKFTNVANDLFDEAIRIAKGQTTKPGIMGSPGVPMTVEEMKSLLKRAMQNIRNYVNLVTTFLGNSANGIKATNGLAAWGVNLQDIVNDNNTYQTKTVQLDVVINSASKQKDLDLIANDIASSIEPLTLVRKTKITTG